MKIDSDDLPIGQVELLRIRSKTGTFVDIVDLCPKRKLQFIDNYSHKLQYKIVDPFSIHKQLAKISLHEVTLPEFYSMFSTYNVLPGQWVCMECFKRAKDNVAASTITIENEVEIDEKEEEDEISAETGHNVVDKSLELFDCSPLKNVKPDRTLQTGKREISKVIHAFSKGIAIALDELALGQSTDHLNCCRLVELINEKLAITEDRWEIIQLLTNVPCDLLISKVAEVFNVSEYTATRIALLIGTNGKPLAAIGKSHDAIDKLMIGKTLATNGEKITNAMIGNTVLEIYW